MFPEGNGYLSSDWSFIGPAEFQLKKEREGARKKNKSEMVFLRMNPFVFCMELKNWSLCSSDKFIGHNSDLYHPLSLSLSLQDCSET